MKSESTILIGEVPAFVIGLAEGTRNVSLCQDLQKMGFEVHRLRSIDSRSSVWPHHRWLVAPKEVKTFLGRELTGGEVGCALSHLRACQEAAESGCKWALILEDDAIISEVLSRLPLVLSTLDESVPQILSLYAASDAAIRRRSICSVPALPGYTLAKYFVPPHGAVAYVVNRQALKLFSESEGVRGVADWPPCAYRISFWGVFPPLAEHPVQDISSTLEFERSMAQTEALGAGWIGNLRYVLRFLWPPYIRLVSEQVGGLRSYFGHVARPSIASLVGRLTQTRMAAKGNTIWLR